MVSELPLLSQGSGALRDDGPLIARMAEPGSWAHGRQLGSWEAAS